MDGKTIRELEELTGFSARSIHHYISRGLLPGAEGSGPAARYGKEHLLRLKLIERARKSGFRVDQRLQDALDGLSLDQMEELVLRAEQSSPEDLQLFGQWLLTGDWGPGGVARRRLAERMPQTAALLQSGSATKAPPREPRRQETWERLRFGDAVEISWRVSRKVPFRRRKLAELLAFAERLFGDDASQ